MRIGHALTMVALASSGAAVAQGVPRLTLPTVIENRTADILRAYNVGNLPIGSTATLSIQSPTGPGNARIELEDFRRVRPADNAADSYPEPQSSLIRIKWNADPALRYVIDCDLRVEPGNPEPTGFFSSVSVTNRGTDIVKNHAGFLTNLNAVGWVTLSANGAFTFRSCSITPVG